MNLQILISSKHVAHFIGDFPFEISVLVEYRDNSSKIMISRSTDTEICLFLGQTHKAESCCAKPCKRVLKTLRRQDKASQVVLAFKSQIPWISKFDYKLEINWFNRWLYLEIR
jgi:hypothetical protein